MNKFLITCVVYLLLIAWNQIQAAPQYQNEINDDGYYFQYSTVDSERSETGKVKEINGEKPIVVTGSYKYNDYFGNVIEVVYEADENGFRPKIVFSKITGPPTNPNLDRPAGAPGALISTLVGNNG